MIEKSKETISREYRKVQGEREDWTMKKDRVKKSREAMRILEERLGMGKWVFPFD